MRTLPMPSTLLRNAYALYALQLANYIIPLLTLPFLVRSLGAEAFGWLAWSAAVNFYFVLLVDAGMNTHAAKELAKLDPQNKAENRHAAGAVVVHVTALKWLLLFASALVMLTCTALITSWHAQWPLFAWCFMTVVGSAVFPTWLFQGLQIMHNTLFFGLAGRVLATCGIFLLVDGPQDLLWAAALQSSATFLSGLMALPTILALPCLAWSRPHWAGICDVARKSRHLAITDYTLTALANSTVFLMGMVFSKEVVGMYAAIEKTIRAAASMFSPLIQAAQPRWVQAWHRQGQIFQPQRLHSWTVVFLLLALVGAVTAHTFAEWGLALLFNEATASHADWAKILSFWLPFNVANAMLSAWWWVASGREKQLAKRVLPGAVLQATVFAWALHTTHTELALWAWVTCEAFMTLLLTHRSGLVSKHHG